LILVNSRGVKLTHSSTPNSISAEVRTLIPDIESSFSRMTEEYNNLRYGEFLTMDQHNMEILYGDIENKLK